MSKLIFERMEDLKKINECARIAYKTMGYKVEKGYDFKNSSHPQEQMCFVIAVRIYNYLNK